MDLIAKKSMRYAGRSLTAGDAFEARPREGKLLKLIGKAEDAPPPRAKPAPKPETDAEDDADESPAPGKSQTYKTRRLKAED